MKTVVSISLGPKNLDYDFETRFLGQDFRVIRIGTNKDTQKAKELIREWQPKCDAIGLGMVREHYRVGAYNFEQGSTKELESLVTDIGNHRRYPARYSARLVNSPYSR